MPFNKDGLVPDLIVNPHAFPSRMTIGHLIESVIAKHCCVSGTIADGTTFEKRDLNSYFDALQEKGFERHGNELLYNGFTGEQISTDIFLGPTYYFRLKHMVKDKINYRTSSKENPVTSTTKQPTQGRSDGGGLRLGEMETTALLSHGLSAFIQEAMMEKSDKYAFVIEKKSGTLAVYNKHYKRSLMNENDKEFSVVYTPYTFKLFIQEMEALGIKPKIICDNEHVSREAANFEDVLVPTEEAEIDD